MIRINGIDYPSTANDSTTPGKPKAPLSILAFVLSLTMYS